MKLGRWRSFAAVGAALTLLTGAARHANAQGTISGRVTAQGTNQPLAEARVLVIGSTLSATTADDGKFTIRNAPAGIVQLQVLRVGFQSQKKSVTVAACMPTWNPAHNVTTFRTSRSSPAFIGRASECRLATPLGGPDRPVVGLDDTGACPRRGKRPVESPTDARKG